jgi:hypothetical protein
VTKPRTYLVRAHGGELAVPDVSSVLIHACGALELADSEGETAAAFAAGEWLSCLLAEDEAGDGDGGVLAEAA